MFIYGFGGPRKTFIVSATNSINQFKLIANMATKMVADIGNVLVDMHVSLVVEYLEQ